MGNHNDMRQAVQAVHARTAVAEKNVAIHAVLLSLATSGDDAVGFGFGCGAEKRKALRLGDLRGRDPEAAPAFPEHRVHFPQRRGAFRDGTLRVVRAVSLGARLVQVLDELGCEPRRRDGLGLVLRRGGG